MFTDRRIERHQLPYFLRVYNSVTDKPIGFLGNVSEDGLMLISQLPMMIGAEFHLRLKIPASDGCQQVIDLNACCLWCHEDQNPGHYDSGFMLGDGTGAGKGRQSAAIILDNWLKGRRRAVWISKSDKLLEDAQRDWKALGQEPLFVTPLARFRQGTPIRLEQGILFATYATLRTVAREERVSRVRQIVLKFD